jgi:hypothetical protein
MTHHAPPARRRVLLPAMLAACAVLALAACSSSNDAPDAVIETSWVIQILSGNGLRGVNVDMRHGDDFAVMSVTPVGPFAAANCEQNVSSGQVRLSCAVSADTDAPFQGWRLVLQHEARVHPDRVLTSMACQGSHADGSTFAVTCDLD